MCLGDRDRLVANRSYSMPKLSSGPEPVPFRAAERRRCDGAHRVAPGWTYGFPELLSGRVEAIKTSYRVTNPCCYPTGALALLRPRAGACSSCGCWRPELVHGYRSL